MESEPGPRITFLSQYFYPEPGATSELISELVFGLSELGFRIDAIAGQPSYHGASTVPRVVSERGVSIRRVWSTQLSKDRTLGRVLNSVTFAASVLFATLRRPKDTVLVALSNPPLLFWVCFITSVLRGHRYLLLVHDVYPEIAIRLGVLRENGLISRLWKFFNRLAYRSAERIIVLGRDMERVVQTYVRKGGRPPISIIPNWADTTAITPRPRKDHSLLEELGIGDRFVVQYSGNIGRFHEIDTILEAAKMLEDSNVYFLFIGTGKQVKKVKAAAAAGSNVGLLPFQPRSELGRTLTACDAALVTLRAGLEGLCVPSKLYGILAAGRPVVAVVPPTSEAAVAVNEQECGFVVLPGDASGLIEAIRRLQSNQRVHLRYGETARKSSLQRYDLQNALSTWAKVLRADA